MALLLTAAQMRAVDGAIIEKLGLPGLVLMENAGRGVAEIIARERPQLGGLCVRIVGGAGQNGGDGFVIARHLLGRGADVKVFLALPAAKIAGDAAAFLRVLRALKADVVIDLSAESQPRVWQERLCGAAVIVDALFGTGLHAQVTGVPAAAVAGMNATDALRVAVDIPSGLDADTGERHGSAVQAHITATMGARKLGLVLDAEAPVGRVEVVDLGVAPESVLPAAQAVGAVCHWLAAEDVAGKLPVRGPAGHKGSAGHLLVIGGSAGKTIATTAAGQAALDAKVLAEMTLSYAEGDTAGTGSFARIAGVSSRMKAAVLGPGIPTGDGMAELVRRLVAELPLPMLVDADGLNLLGAEAAACAAGARAGRIFTPHPGEMARLRGSTIGDVQKDRLGAARELAAAARAVVVLKGARTIIATPDGTAYVNPTANPALGTAGSGDVLAGAIGAFLAQGLGVTDAAVAGVFVHGLAAEVATRTLGGSHLMASDLPDAIARACEELRS
jgi:hydroxyethylthiazole kinase-like uncharacterized protein yjeF